MLIRATYFCIALQAIALVFVSVVPFGFDHPAPGQVDFGYLFLAMVGYGLATMAGVAFAIGSQRWRFAIGYFIVSVLLALAVPTMILPLKEAPMKHVPGPAEEHE